MKKIGVILRSTKIGDDEYKVLNREIIDFLSCYSVILIGILYDSNLDYNKASALIDMCDGVIMPGGDVISEIDLSLARYLYEKDKPTLGICMGYQVMAKALGADIELLSDNNHYSKDKYVHYVTIKKDSKLYNILGKEVIRVNSRHKYHILNTKLDVNAYSNDYVIEGIEDKNKKFYIGVQWHIESLKDDIYSRLLIEEFIRVI